MALSVIGAGFGRTGTMSLKQALEQLGLGRCHHMEEVMGHPAQVPLWADAAAGKPDWNRIFDGYGCMVDWPGAHFWRELADFYPDAKVLLSVRPEEAWWNSYSETIATVLAMREKIPVPHIRDMMGVAQTLIAERTFKGATDKVSILSAYRRRIEEVKAAIPPERLLVFNVAEGWEPLCRFLGKPVPETQFPRVNSAEEFKALMRKMSGG